MDWSKKERNARLDRQDAAGKLGWVEEVKSLFGHGIIFPYFFLAVEHLDWD